MIGGDDKTVLNGINASTSTPAVVDVARCRWVVAGVGVQPRQRHLRAGGRTPDGRSNQIYRVDPITGAVTAAGTLPEERSDSTVAVSGTTAYLFGGLTPTPTDSIVAITAA